MSAALFDPGSAFTTGLVLLAGAFLAGAAIHAFAARHRDLRGDHAALAVVCATACAYLVLEACMYGSHDPARHALFRRCEQVAVAPFMVAYAAYVAGLGGFPRRRAALVGAVVSAVAVAVAAASSAGLWLARIDHLDAFALPWGEKVMLARGPASPWMAYSLGTWVALTAFGIWCALRHRRVPGALGVRALLLANAFFFAAMVHDSLLDAGAIRGVFVSELVAPALAGAMWWRVAAAHRRRVDAWRRLFARAGDAILVHDVEAERIVDANEAACALLRRPREALLHSDLAAALGDGQTPAAAVAPGGTALVERDCRRSDDTSFPAEIGLRRASAEGRELVVASLRDLSQRRRAERELVENERHLRQVIERCPIPVAESDAAGRALAFNPSFDRQFGYALSEVDSVSAWARLAEPDAEMRRQTLARWDEAIAAARAGDGVVPPFRAAMRDRAGLPRQVDISSVIVGERMVTFIADRTEILAARDELAEQEALQRAVIEEAADGVVVSSLRPGQPEPAIELWNQGMAGITGMDGEAARAVGWSALVGRERAMALREPARDLELELLRPDGTRRLCLVSSSEVPGAPGARRLVAFVRDITAQRRAEAERRELDAQAQRGQQFETLGLLAGGIAHDFNNLLMTILGRAGLVRALTSGDAAAREDLDEMEAAAKRAATLCQQLLAYAGRGGARVGAVDLAGLARGMEEMLTLGVSKRIAFARDYDARAARVTGDAGQLRQVILNLVTNAAEAIGDHAGSIRLRVDRVALEAPRAMAAGVSLPAGDYARLEIADSGPGMDAATCARIFEPFFSTKFTGRGLGLAVVLGIVRGHRGGIEVESAPGAGTTVRVLLPALAAEEPVATSVPAMPPVTGRRGRALVVDDEPAMRAITAEMLGHLGFTVDAVASAREAIAELAQAGESPRLVILDLSLPDATGEEVLRHLRGRVARARVIVASGYARDDVQRFLGGAEVDGILTKPYGLDDLTAAVAAAGTERA